MPHSYDPGTSAVTAPDAGEAPAQRDRAAEHAFEPLPEADARGETVAPTRNRVRNTPGNTPAEDQPGESDPPSSLRERSVLEFVARLRLVPLNLVHQSLFAGVSRQIAGRIVGRMVRRGWLRTWAESRETGGHPTWLYTTAAGRKIGLGIVLDAVKGTHIERLVSAMLPSAQTRPLDLRPRIVPSFLRHQQETVTLLVRLAVANGAIWYSAWDRPLPQGNAPIPLPQPDGILVLPGGTGPELVFLEHDRGMESPAHFARAKAERYAELAVRPELCQQLLGFTTFRLAVTVENFRIHRLPMERLVLLARLLREAGAARDASLSLAGWANWWPAGTVWCRADEPFEPKSRPAAELQDPVLRHTLLCPAVQPGIVCACRAQLDPPFAL